MTTTFELELARAQRPQSVVGITDAFTRTLRANKCVEQLALMFRVDQLPRVVLAVHADKLYADCSEHRRSHWRSIDPRARSTICTNLALEHEEIVVGIDATFIEQRAKRGQPGRVEHALNRRFVRARSHTIGCGTLAKQHAQTAHDQRLARTRLASEDVQSWSKRQGHRVNHRDVSDAQFNEHLSPAFCV